MAKDGEDGGKARARASKGRPPGRGGGKSEVKRADQRLVWDDLRVLLAVHRAGSLARAAEGLGVDAATVSRRLTALEAALGTILFKRAKAGMSATDAGSAVVRRAAEIEHKMMLIHEDVAETATPTGAVRLVGGMWTIWRFAAVGAPLLHAAHPGVALRLVPTRPPGEVGGEVPSLSLWFEAPPRENEFAIVLGDVPYAVYGPAGTADAAALPTLAHRSETGTARVPDRWARAREDGRFEPPLAATDSLILREAVRSGLGKALLPMCLGDGDPALQRIGGGPPELARALSLHVHPDSIQLPRVQAVIATLRTSFAAVFAPDPPGGGHRGAAIHLHSR